MKQLNLTNAELRYELYKFISLSYGRSSILVKDLKNISKQVIGTDLKPIQSKDLDKIKYVIEYKDKYYVLKLNDERGRIFNPITLLRNESIKIEESTPDIVWIPVGASEIPVEFNVFLEWLTSENKYNLISGYNIKLKGRKPITYSKDNEVLLEDIVYYRRKVDQSIQSAIYLSSDDTNSHTFDNGDRIVVSCDGAKGLLIKSNGDTYLCDPYELWDYYRLLREDGLISQNQVPYFSAIGLTKHRTTTINSLIKYDHD